MKLVYCSTRETLKCNSLVQKICVFLQKETSHCKNSFALRSPRGPELNCYKFTISCELGPLSVKWRYDMFPSIKMEEYMESELSGICWVKAVTKNTVIGSLGIHFMHMRANVGLILIKLVLYCLKKKSNERCLKEEVVITLGIPREKWG